MWRLYSVYTNLETALGTAIINALLRAVPAAQLVASVRDPSKATAFAERGVQVRAGDFAQPASLPAAFAGAGQVLVISVDKLGEAALQMHRAAIEAARAAGAQRILYTSHQAARADSLFAPAVDHAATEAFLAEQEVAFTSLRHGFYAESALHLMGQGLKDGVIRAPADGPVSWTTRADLAEADAVILAQEGRLDGITPPLTALEAVTLDEVAALASEIAGREIKRVTISDDEWRQATSARGVPAPMAEMLLGMYLAARRGEFATVDPTLETLLGRRPHTMREVLARVLKPTAA